MVTRHEYYKQLRQEPIQFKSLGKAAGSFPEISVLVEGNRRFCDSIANSSNLNLLKEQTEEGQSSGFCSWAAGMFRLTEVLATDANSGVCSHLATPVCLKVPSPTRHLERSSLSVTSPTATSPTTINPVSVLSYAVSELGVGHVIVVGHQLMNAAALVLRSWRGPRARQATLTVL